MSKEGSIEKGGILAGVAVIALFIYPFVAQAWNPPLEPTRTIMHLQARWNHGMYGVFITFFTTFVVIFQAIVIPLLLFFGLLKLIAGPKTQDPSLTLPTGSSLTWRRGGDFALAAGGLALILAPAGFFYVVFTAPDKLNFLGSQGGFALFFAAFAPLPGFGMVFDATVAKTWHVGRIESLTQSKLSDGTPSDSYDLVVEKKKVTINATLAAKLKVEEKIAVRTSAVFDRVVELRR